MIVDKDYEQLRDSFNLSKCCEKWFIFDKTGSVRAQGSYDTDEASSALHHVADGEQAYSPETFLEKLKRLDAENDLTQIRTGAANSPTKTVIAALFSSLCTGCNDGHLLELLKSSADKKIGANYLVLLPGTFSRTDLINFKTNLQVPFPVELADLELTNVWMSLNEQYGEKQINGTVVVYSNQKVKAVVNGIDETKQLLQALEN